MAQVYLMSSRLGRIWFSNAIAGLAWLNWPYTVCVGDRCKVGRCSGEVLIALVSILAVIFLAVIYAVIYTYGK